MKVLSHEESRALALKLLGEDVTERLKETIEKKCYPEIARVVYEEVSANTITRVLSEAKQPLWVGHAIRDAPIGYFSSSNLDILIETISKDPFLTGWTLRDSPRDMFNIKQARILEMIYASRRKKF